LDANAYQTGLTVSGKATGATSVELKIGSKTITPKAYVDSSGSWSMLISSDQLPVSKVGSITTIESVAINSYGAVSGITQAQLLFDTSNPSILNIVNEGDKIRVVFDETVLLPVSSVDSMLRVRSGSRSIGIKSLQSLQNTLGNTELLLELSEALPVDTVVKLSYSGNGFTDKFGNQLPQFSNRIVTDLASSTSISGPGYSYTNIVLTGSDKVNISGSSYDTSIAGNSADNILEGGGGADIITGGLGRDTFVYSSYKDSVLIDPVTGKSAVDRITDFAIGTDVIDGPYSVSKNSLLRFEVSGSSAPSSAVFQALLPASVLLPGGAAFVSFAASQKAFIVLNDGKAGFNSKEDILIDITGYSGNPGSLTII
jgi:Ca2+-binding RTX toxin-like protein